MIDWLSENVEWIFSGIGVFVLTGIVGAIKMKRKNKKKEISSFTVNIGDNANISGNIAGRDVVINTVSHDSMAKELIPILKLRADRIRSQLTKHYGYASIKEYLSKFDSLHNDHISALEKNNFVLAHELLSAIYDLSRDLERDEFWSRHHAETPDFRYSLRRDAFQRGLLICEYVVGDMKAYSELYPSSECWDEKIESADKIYKRILDSNKL